MERQEAKNIAIDCLLEKSTARDFYSDTFDRYMNTMDDESIPISPVKLDEVENNKVLINEQTYDILMKIMDITRETNREIPYFLIGYEQLDGSITFETILTDLENDSVMEADFDNISDYLGAYIESLDDEFIRRKGMPIICSGHTHGRGVVSDNFSFGDMISYVSFKSQIRDYASEINPRIEPMTLDTVGMLINLNGDLNMVYYDDNPNKRGFYKFTNIYLKKNNGNVELLPSISDNGNYIKSGINK